MRVLDLDGREVHSASRVDVFQMTALGPIVGATQGPFVLPYASVG
jgi:hypothetical protein